MITHTSTVTLDISCTQPRAEVIAKQDDNNTRYVTASFVNSGTAVALTGVTSAELRVLRPDGRMVTSSATVSGNTVTAVLPQNALGAAGRGYGDILLKNGTQIISAARFSLIVKPAAVSNDQITGDSEFAVFEERLAATESDLTSFKNQYNTEKIGVDNAIRSLNSRLGGLKFAQITAEAYAALNPPEPSTVYYVTDEKGNVTQYLGAVKLMSGANTVGSAVALADGTAVAVSGAAAEITDA